jgi:hypothetical protein
MREAFKEDLPDINLFHIFMFLLILFPLWYPFVSANFFNDTSVKKEQSLKEEFLKKGENQFFEHDLFYNISTFQRNSEDVLEAIRKSDTLEVYLKEIGYEVIIIPLDKFERLKDETKGFREASSFSTFNNIVIKEKRVYYSATKIYINRAYFVGEDFGEDSKYELRDKIFPKDKLFRDIMKECKF